MNRAVAISLALLLGMPACDSIVDANRHRLEDVTDAAVDTQSVSSDAARADASPDIVPGPDAFLPDAPPDVPPDVLDVDAGPVCGGADLQVDPDNCGVCGHVCASGLCDAGHCVGEPWGHVVAIGHDYASSHASQRRVLANAMSLGASADLAVAAWPGISPMGSYGLGLGLAMVERAHPWHPVPFPATPGADALDGVDVVVVPPEMGAGDQVAALAADWASTFDTYLRRGGVIVVLATAGSTVQHFGDGAALFVVDPVVEVTDQATKIVDGTDAIADGVIAPYKAETVSVAFPNAPSPVVTTTAGDIVVFHVTR